MVTQLYNTSTNKNRQLQIDTKSDTKSRGFPENRDTRIPTDLYRTTGFEPVETVDTNTIVTHQPHQQ